LAADAAEVPLEAAAWPDFSLPWYLSFSLLFEIISFSLTNYKYHNQYYLKRKK